LAEVHNHSISLIVCLSSFDEIREKSTEYSKALEMSSAPCAVRRFPICDYQGPDDDEAFWSLANEVAAHLRHGKSVLVHCGAGIGRTGMFAIAALMALSVPLNEAEQKRQVQHDALRRINERHCNLKQ
jgi:protein-tyrosine phosphatase